MSRVHVKNNNRARQPAAPRLLKTKDISNDTYQEPTSRRNKGPKYHANGYKRRRKAASPSVSESSGDFDAEDASDEKSDDDDEDDEEDNEPALLAPARSGLSLEPGLPEFDVVEADVELESPYPLPILEDEYPTFNFDGPEPDLSLAIESEDYNEVDNISESDDANSEMYEEQQLLNQLTDEDELEELDLLNQIDGMSAYGFGDDSDAGAYHSSQGSETAAEDAPERHVRFQVDEAAAFRPTILQSPTFSRTLLPAAFGHQRGLLGEPLRPDLYDSSSEDEDYDSDATEECLPPEAHMQEQDPEQSEPKEVEATTANASQTDVASKRKGPKGPRWGIFIDDGAKASGMLDRTGRIMLITHPHLLGDEFARRSNDSSNASPSTTLEGIPESGSEFAETPDYSNITDADIMLGNLNSSIDVNGIVTGPQEAFIPQGFKLDDFADFGSESGMDDDEMAIEAMIKFDDSSDNDSDTSATPVYATPRTPASAHPHGHISSLSSAQVTAFRRHADPNFAAFKTTPSYSRLTELSSPVPSHGSRKRKSFNESPYASSHYEGVTPVQRMRASDHSAGSPGVPHIIPSTPDTVRATKRQRMMTT